MNPGRKLQGLLGIILLSICMIGCVRPEESLNLSKLQIVIPKSMSSQKVGAQDFDQLAHLAINVTGEGISQPIFYSWDGNQGDTAVSAPASFQLDIPQGNNRLIQVLAVYKNSEDSSQMQFYYGDVTQNLSQTSESAAVTVTSVGQGNTIISGRIAGRYFDTPTSGPTSSIDMVFTPSGKPSMIVDRSAIVNGWFQFFGLIGAQFGYRLDNGSLLFGKAIDLTDSMFPGSTTTLRVAVPLHQSYRYPKGGGTPVWTPEDPTVYIYGFFGDSSALSGKAICKSNTPATVNLAKSGNSSVKLVATSTPPPTDLFQANLPNMYLSGGAESGDGPCGMPNYYNTNLGFNPTMLDNGNDNSAGFRIPFTVTSGNSVTSAIVDSSTRSLSGTLLPGIPAAMDKMMAFKKVGIEDTHSDFASCLEMLPQGFVPAGEGNVTSTTFSMNLSLTATEIASKVVVALCPMKNGKMASRGAWVRGHVFNSGGGGGGGGGVVTPPNPPTQIKIMVQNDLALLINPNSCVAIKVDLLGSNNLPAFYSSGSFPVNLSGSSAITSLHESYDTNCMGPGIPGNTLNFSNGMNSQILFMKMIGSFGSFNIQGTSAGLSNIPLNVTLTNSALAPYKWAFLRMDTLKVLGGAETVIPGLCIPVLVQIQDINGAPLYQWTVAPGQSVAVASLFSGGSLYNPSDRDCLGASVATLNWFDADAGGHYRANNFYNLKPTGAISGPQISTLSFTTPAAAYTVGVTAMPAASKMMIEVIGANWQGAGMSIPRGICLPIKVKATDASMGYGLPGSTRFIDVAVTASGMTPPTVIVSGSSACTGVATVYPTTIGTTTPFAMTIYMKVTDGTVDSKVSLTATDNTGSGTNLSTSNWPMSSPATADVFNLIAKLSYVDPTNVNYKWVALSPATWGGVPQGVSDCQEFRVELLDPMNNPYTTPANINFTATRNGASTTGFVLGCPNAGGNNYTISSGNSYGSVYFNPAYGSVAAGPENININVPGISTTGSPLPISVGLKLVMGLTASPPVVGSCNNSYYANLVTYNSQPVSPSMNLGGSFAASLTYSVTGFAGGPTLRGQGNVCGASTPLSLGGGASNISYFIDTTANTGAYTGISGISFSLADATWATANISVVP